MEAAGAFRAGRKPSAGDMEGGLNMYEFDKCIVAEPNGGQLTEGTVSRFGGTTVHVHADEGLALRPGLAVNLFVYDRVQGECVFTGTVTRVLGDNVVISGANLVRSTQKRNNTRVEKILHYRITQRYGSEGPVLLEPPIDFTILNISAQGMYIGTDAVFAEGHRFPFVFRDAGKPIEIKAEVVRCERRVRGNRYGCRFVDISERDMDNIYRFVLHEQIEQRRRNLIV